MFLKRKFASLAGARSGFKNTSVLFPAPANAVGVVPPPENDVLLAGCPFPTSTNSDSGLWLNAGGVDEADDEIADRLDLESSIMRSLNSRLT